MDLGLIKRVCDFVGEDACREARYDLGGSSIMGRVEDVVVDEDVIAEERELRLIVRTSMCVRRSWRTLYFMFLKRPPTRLRYHGMLAMTDCEHTECGQVYNMGRLVFLEQLLGLFKIPVHTSISLIQAIRGCLSHLRSPSLEPANTHVSPVFFPKREPAGSVSMMCLMALPTRPVPPVTSITDCDIGAR